ncbi:HEPN-associated N-terminal domain-containing protein [Variovorax paradoxus]|uniref:HEPN-associated N-terminal domain-containing protein n=1 Tax=Variovorax paradoxus TaxID=34073 RepID=UPI001ABC0A9E
MGRVLDAEMIELRRGYRLRDTRYVCSECVEDSFLKKTLDEAASATSCSFCGRSSDSPCAAPFDELMRLIAKPLLQRFNDVDRAGTPSADGGYISSTLSTDEVLDEIEFHSTQQVRDAVVGAFTIEVWVEAPDGRWGELPYGQELSSAWQQFCFVVKHQTRFHFHTRVSTESTGEIAAGEMLDEIADIVTRTRLVQEVPAGTVLFRGRILNPASAWEPNAQELGAPPREKARANRMNPAGIAYMYLAFDQKTMLSELGALKDSEIIIGAKFVATRPLRVVDFTDLPSRPSLFDPERRHLDQHVAFLQDFVSRISQPVRPGTEDIHYVPTQVVSEYLAQAFQVDGADALLDGVIYPSAKMEGGRNLVVFPARESFGPQFPTVQFLEHIEWETLVPIAPKAAAKLS